MMLGAGPKPDAADDTIILRDDRLTSTGAGEIARYAISPARFRAAPATRARDLGFGASASGQQARQCRPSDLKRRCMASLGTV